MRTCKICGNEFEGHWAARYCSDACRDKGRRTSMYASQKRYRQTDKGKQAVRKALAKYRASDKGKQAVRDAYYKKKAMLEHYKVLLAEKEAQHG